MTTARSSPSRSRQTRSVWAGVDVGGRRKGFHAALIDSQSLLAGPMRLASVAEVVAWLLSRAPRLVAVDSPRSAAPNGCLSRPEERQLAREVCGIRYTPARALLETNAYYEWILHGFELYRGLENAALPAIECFPTASWTRWAGRRGAKTRASWSREALAGLGLAGVPTRTSQDARDAVAAAVTARCHDLGSTRSFVQIVVPR